MKNLISQALKTAEVVDGFTESGGERQKTLSDRHTADMSSDNWLSKSIRPMTLLILLALEALVIVLEAAGFAISLDTKLQLGGLLGAAISFYFASKKSERVAAQNAKANVHIEKMKVKSERKEARFKRRLMRRKERKQDTQ